MKLVQPWWMQQLICFIHVAPKSQVSDAALLLKSCYFLVSTNGGYENDFFQTMNSKKCLMLPDLNIIFVNK